MDVFVSVCEHWKKYDLSLAKLSSVATDEAPSFYDGEKIKDSLKDYGEKRANENVEHTFHRTHCVIRLEVLCTKLIIIAHVRRLVKQMVNFYKIPWIEAKTIFDIFITILKANVQVYHTIQKYDRYHAPLYWKESGS